LPVGLKRLPFIEIIPGVGNLDHLSSFDLIGDVFYWFLAKKAVIRSVEIKYHFEKIQLCSCKPAHPGIAAGDPYGFVEAQQVKITVTYGPLNPLESIDTGLQQLELSGVETDISMVMDVEISHFVEIVFDVRVVII